MYGFTYKVNKKIVPVAKYFGVSRRAGIAAFLFHRPLPGIKGHSPREMDVTQSDDKSSHSIAAERRQDVACGRPPQEWNQIAQIARVPAGATSAFRQTVSGQRRVFKQCKLMLAATYGYNARKLALPRSDWDENVMTGLKPKRIGSLLRTAVILTLSCQSLLESTHADQPSRGVPEGSVPSLRNPVLQIGDVPMWHNGGPVKCASLSSDGKIIASCGTGGLVHLWDPATGKQVESIRVQADERIVRNVGEAKLSMPLLINGVAFSPDNKLFVVGASDGNVSVWSIKEKKQLWVVKAHEDFLSEGVSAVAFSLDGASVISAGGGDWGVRTWDSKSGKALFSLQRDAFARFIMWSPNGKQIAFDAEDNSTVIFDIGLKKVVHKFNGGKCAAFSPDGNRMVTVVSNRFQCQVWNLETGKEVFQISESPGAVAFSPDGRLLAGALYYGRSGSCVCFWDATSGKEVTRLVGHGDRVTFIAFAPDGKTIISGSEDGTLRVWDVVAGKPLVAPSGHGRPVRTLAFSPDGATLASASEDATIRLWESTNGRSMRIITLADGYSRELVFAPDGKTLFSANANGEIGRWDVATGTAHPPISKKGEIPDLRSIAVSPDGRLLAAGCEEKKELGGGTIRLFDLKTGTLVKRFTNLGDSAVSIAFSADNLKISSANGGGSISVLDVTTGKRYFDIAVRRHFLHSITFFPNSESIACAGEAGLLGVWNARSGKQSFLMPTAHRDDIRVVRVSPDGKSVVSGGDDGIVCFWNAQTGQQQDCFRASQRALRTLTYSPDGRLLATAGDGLSISIWRIDFSR